MKNLPTLDRIGETVPVQRFLGWIGILPLFLILVLPLQAEKYEVDKNHSSIGFTVKHLLVSDVDGVFEDYDIAFEMVQSDIRKMDLDVTVESIDTRNQRRDNHLRSDDYFGIATHPKLTYRSTGYKGNGRKGKLTGELTIKGITQKVLLDVNISEPVQFDGKEVLGISAEGKINRKDFEVGVGVPSAIVSDEVEIKITLEVNR